MCNPRRVMIQLTRAVNEAWRTTIGQVASASGEVQELARITTDIPLDTEMGDVALQMLERIMRGEIEGYEPWECDSEGNYRRDMGDVVLIYQTGSHQLIVEARLTELISAEAKGTAEASGYTVGEVAVQAVGNYYKEGFGGRTKEVAEKEAYAEAERKLAEATEALHRRQHALLIETAEKQARSIAEQQATADLMDLQTQMREALHEQLQVILANAEERIHHTMNQLVGEAYRQVLIQLVQENGGRVLNDERSGSVINLEVELF